ncbi:sigma-54-dependent Fis family transcriptional regulator [Paludibacterium yongneupense]|uniref:sigma-54-dependent Fis family transcriptional regulator n=1 Tax=Paludibacterium yongneupense TaxID=400061 RepID=UPI00041E6B25|nr:sigma-54-dependent Fis family transcriptional regulator [Paludibacterium yongneupense]
MPERTVATTTQGGMPADPPSDGGLDRAHQRSRGYGLLEYDTPHYPILAADVLRLRREQNRALQTHALPVMEALYQQIANTHSMVALTDAKGLILHSFGDDDFLKKAARVALRAGSDWNEEHQGTNAIGTALAERRAVTVHGTQHFLRANQFLTCSSVPIFEPSGQLGGILDVTGDQRGYHAHTLALVRMSAQMIENHLFDHAFGHGFYLRFHSRREFIGTLMEGLVAFSGDGILLAANGSARFQLGLDGMAHERTLAALFGIAPGALLERCRLQSAWLELHLHGGVQVCVQAQWRGATPGAAPAPTPGTSALPHLRYLNTGDAQVGRLLDKVAKVIGRDIPILITGETGTGKELLAQAIHRDSPRAGASFVAVNCAAIPETLIESELFGYVDGAFSGARRKGYRGKLMQANGGTLFLDEIGDMPLPLQMRLLRVLQEREVEPLGGSGPLAVDFSLICATNRDLQAMIAAGRFREDLYYRINGLVVRLPPVRERSDLDVIVRKILQAESRHCGAREVSPEVMALFHRYAWPGNFRQLAALLRTACAIADDDGVIRPAHLPDDFMPDDAPSVALSRQEHDAIAAAVTAHRGNVSAAARALGISRNTIYRKLGSKH